MSDTSQGRCILAQNGEWTLPAAGLPEQGTQQVSSLWPGLGSGKQPPPRSPDTGHTSAQSHLGFLIFRTTLRCTVLTPFYGRGRLSQLVQCEFWCLLSKPLACSYPLTWPWLFLPVPRPFNSCANRWGQKHDSFKFCISPTYASRRLQIYLLPPPFNSQVLKVCVLSLVSIPLMWLFNNRETSKSNTVV